MEEGSVIGLAITRTTAGTTVRSAPVGLPEAVPVTCSQERAMRRERALLVIAHRMSTVEAVDTVVMLANGTARATGTYTELLRSNPGFQRLVDRTAGVNGARHMSFVKRGVGFPTKGHLLNRRTQSCQARRPAASCRSAKNITGGAA
ncbi:hypothetical protein ACH4VR_05445 [Streptomyces sp. NPDC020883]|uniref:hypothetical protein n=1 Tax=Streptomyces sp. NPDC020883 TaxID=3365099 RepID=UPI0037B040C6